jgi:hypothetical protein
LTVGSCLSLRSELSLSNDRAFVAHGILELKTGAPKRVQLVLLTHKQRRMINFEVES